MNCIALIFLTALTGCALFDGPYEWHYTGHVCESYSWTKVEASRLASFCGEHNPNLPGQLAGCRLAGTCAVVSKFSEEEAKTIIGIDGLSVYDHEVKHLKGWKHQ